MLPSVSLGDSVSSWCVSNCRVEYRIAKGRSREDPFHGFVLPELSLLDLYNLKLVSRHFNIRTSEYLRRRSSIRLILEKFFDDPHHALFLEALAVSGSTLR